MFYLAQALSIISILIAVVGLQQKEKNKIVLFMGISNVFVTGSYYFLGAKTGFYLMIVATLRMFAFYYIGTRKDFNKILSILILIFFELFQIGTSIYAYEGWLTILELCGFLLYTYGCWQKNKNFLLVTNICLSCCHITYNSFHRGYFNIVLELILICASLYPLIKDKYTKEKEVYDYGS